MSGMKKSQNSHDEARAADILKDYRNSEIPHAPKIIPIEKLKDTKGIAKLCKTTNEPVFLTKNGYGEIVIMSAETYNRMFGDLEAYRDLAISEQEYKEGKSSDAYEALERIKDKHGL